MDTDAWLRRRDALAERVALWINSGRAESWLLDASDLQFYKDLPAGRPAQAPELLPELLNYLALSRRSVWLSQRGDVEARWQKWERARRPENLLLGWHEVGTFKAWVEERPDDVPPPAPGLLAYIERSHEKARSQERASHSTASRSVVARELDLPAAAAPQPRAASAAPRTAPAAAPRSPLAPLKASDMEAAWMAVPHLPVTPAAATAAEADIVDVSVFAPPKAQPDTTIMIQVMLHLLGDLDAATDRATLADDAAALRVSTTLDVLVPRGAKATVMLIEPRLEITQPVQSIVWRGRLGVANFIVKVPRTAYGDLFPTVHVAIDAAMVGQLRFKLGIAGSVSAPGPNALQPASPRRYQRAFFSYSSQDRVKALEVAQCYRLAGIEVFQDVLNLDPGVRWERRLYQEIDRCDLFLLLWSRAASESKWVAREARYALERRNDTAEQRPDLLPLIIEGPPVAEPPDFLAHLHFNDFMRLAIVAYSPVNGDESRRRPS